MPKIDAASVVEHRAQVLARLIDAAEELLRNESQTLTAGAVSARAGIARNSIYRYVDSIDDLAWRVVERHLPGWARAVRQAVSGESGAEQRLLIWAEAHLCEAARSGHGWMMRLAGNLPATERSQAVVDRAHRDMREVVHSAWTTLLPDDDELARVAGQLSQAMLEAGFRQLEAGVDPDVVVRVTRAGLSGLVHELQNPRDMVEAQGHR